MAGFRASRSNRWRYLPREPEICRVGASRKQSRRAVGRLQQRQAELLLTRMADEMVFMMGNFPAKLPGDRSYSDNHLWLKQEQDVWQVGFTAYSVRLLQDVYFLQWAIEPKTRVRRRAEIGEIESSKALSTLYAPCDAEILEFN